MGPSAASSFFGIVFLALFLWGLGLDLSMIRRRGKTHARLVPGPVPWGLWDLVLIVLFFLVCQQGLLLLFQAVVSATGASAHLRRLFSVVLNAGVALLTAFYLGFLLKRRYGMGWKSLGLDFPVHRRDIALGFVYYCASIPLLFFAGLMTKIMADHFAIPLEPQEPLRVLMKETSYLNLFLMSVFVVAVAPFSEEIFFRGFLYPLMKKFMGARGSLVLSSCLFASLHFSFLAFLPVMCMGFFLVLVYERTGSLFSAITFHALNNLVAVLIVLFVIK